MDDPIINLVDDLDIDYTVDAEMPEDRPDQLERASWHLKMASRLARERDELNVVYQAEIERLTNRWRARAEVFANRIEWHERPVRELHMALLAEDPKRKTIHLPYGTSKVRVSKTPRVRIVDQPTLLAWAEQNWPDILGRTINVTGVKEIVARLPKLEPGETSGVTDLNGELIPGAAATMPESSWSVSYEVEQ